jgi:hypothetical protein
MFTPIVSYVGQKFRSQLQRPQGRKFIAFPVLNELHILFTIIYIYMVNEVGLQPIFSHPGYKHRNININ